MNKKRAVLALKLLLWVGALAPGAWLLNGLYRGGLGANPVETLTHWTGTTALILLLLTLAISPVRRFTGWNPLIQLRRPMGLFAFFYAVAHFSVWFAFDMVFNFGWMLDDIVKRKFITVGMAALVVLLPLALTSTRLAIRKLGKRWAKLHRGIYVATALGLIHSYWGVKADTRLPLVYAAFFVGLMLLRLPHFRAAKKKPRTSTPDGDAAVTA